MCSVAGKKNKAKYSRNENAHGLTVGAVMFRFFLKIKNTYLIQTGEFV
jgi:hypothetical protein